MLRIDTVRVDKAESKEDLYLMSLRVSADNKGLKDLSNALDNVLYTIEHSEALLSEPVGLIEVDDEDTSLKVSMTRDVCDIVGNRFSKGSLFDQGVVMGRIGERIDGPIEVTGIDSLSGNFYYVKRSDKEL